MNSASRWCNFLDRGISLVAHAGEVFLKTGATRHGAYCEVMNLLPEEFCGFSSYRLTTDRIFAVRRLRELGRGACVPLFLCFISLQQTYDSVDRTHLWEHRWALSYLWNPCIVPVQGPYLSCERAVQGFH